MSFFPVPSSPELRRLCPTRPAQYPGSLWSPTMSCFDPIPQYHWTPRERSDYHGLPTNDSMSWSQQAHQGSTQLYSSYETPLNRTASTLPITWHPSPWDLYHANVPSSDLHRFAASGLRIPSQDPDWSFNAITVSSTPVSATISPSFSVQSASSLRSPMTWSDSQSKSDQQIRASPKIKVEQNVDHYTQGFRSLLESSAFQQPQLVRPEDLAPSPMMDASSWNRLSQPAADSMVESPEEHEDAPLELERPACRRWLSAADIDNLLPDGHRQKRTHTKADNACCSCDICGKLFQRTYNLKAHLFTHDPHRTQPHACMRVGCDKRFLRRTDLIRHEQSVHIKSRDFACHLCPSSFARKDTLRR